MLGTIRSFPLENPIYAVVVLQEGVYTIFERDPGNLAFSKIGKEGISIVINYYYTLRKFN